jgi:GT2 family glycosyltransferase/glycosyltransferase involved in cell wall biosynthesis
MPKVSIIVPLWNHLSDVIIPFLDALEKTSYEDYELILVDNGSVDGTAEYIKKVYKEKKYKNFTKFIANPKNLGFGGGNNKGYAVAEGKYILFMSDDVMVEDPDWLTTLVNTAEANPKTLLGDRLITWNQLTLFRNAPTQYIAGYLMFGSKEMFDEVKEGNQVFDEDFGPAYFEDTFLSARCAHFGYALKEIPNLGVNHLGSKSSDQIDINAQTIYAQKHFTNRMMGMYLEKIGKKRIVFYFKCAYPFIDGDYEGKGVGGAESALILLARQFAQNGWQTEIYNTTQVTGTFNGVEYHNVKEFNPTDFMDVFVLFREPYINLPHVNAITKIFWSCDQYTIGDWKTVIFPYVDKIIAISPYHAKYLDFRYGPLGDKLKVIELGVNYEDYKTPIEKKPGKVIFCSVPHRGLDHLARLWPTIKQRVPGAQLFVTSDYRLWGLDTPSNAEFVQALQNIPDVFFLGKVSRAELIEHQKTAEVMAYPCTYEECFCISAMECIAAGAIPVTTPIGALRTTVAESGILIDGLPGQAPYDAEFIENVCELLTNKSKAKELRDAAAKRVKEKYTYEEIYKEWQRTIEVIEMGGGE